MGVNQKSDRSSTPLHVVVAAAIVRDGRVLAARRTRPAELAGRWEFPGGKVEPGETDAAALVRECREELGVRVRVLHRVGPEIAMPSGASLRCYHATLKGGSAEPRPGADHDALRWLGVEELHDVAWLPADRPLAEALRDLLARDDALPEAENALPGGERPLPGRQTPSPDGERRLPDREKPLSGGHVGGAVRIGATVRRPTGPWTPTVHALLRHVRRADLPGVPDVLGVDEQGREILSFVKGTTLGAAPPNVQRSDVVLVQAMRWLAAYHRAVSDFRPPDPQWRLDPRPAGADEIICHNDIAPSNLVVSDAEAEPRLIGVLDWDVAGPGLPIDDVAFAAWNLVPLSDERLSGQSVARRLRLLVESYGRYAPEEVLQRVPVRLHAGMTRIRAGATRGDAGMRNLLDSGRITATERALERFEHRLPEFLRAVRR